MLSKEDLKELLMDDGTSPEKMESKLGEMINLISISGGPKSWEEGIPITTVVKIPKLILDVATMIASITPDPSFTRQEFLENYIASLIRTGLIRIVEEEGL
jgi:hypothetical protein